MLMIRVSSIASTLLKKSAPAIVSLFASRKLDPMREIAARYSFLPARTFCDVE